MPSGIEDPLAVDRLQGPRLEAPDHALRPDRLPDVHASVRPMDDRYLLVNIATGVIADALGY